MAHRHAADLAPLGTPAAGSPASRPVEILLVEDNPGDVRLVREALRHGPLACRLHVAEDGLSALEMLRGAGSALHPDIILLDLNLPGLSGRAVLEVLKEDGVLRNIPVVVLTSSDAEKDVAAAYGLRANCYVRKPLDLERFIDAIHTIERFWFQLARLPSSRID